MPSEYCVKPVELSDLEECGRIFLKSFIFSHELILLNVYPPHLAPGVSLDEKGTLWGRAAAQDFEKKRSEGLHWVKACTADDPTPLGFARWESPTFTSSLYDAPPEQSAAKIEEEIDSMMDGEFTERFVSAIKEGRKAQFKKGEEHWYLELLAISPYHQRKGLGKLLVQYGIDQAGLAQPPTPLYLESSTQGEKMYVSLGFYEVRRVKVEIGWRFKGAVGEGEDVVEAAADSKWYVWPAMLR